MTSRSWFILRYIKAKFSKKRGLTLKDAVKRNLKWNSNVHGDFIWKMNCRSLWTDEFGNWYHCDNIVKLDYQDHRGIMIG